MAAVENTRCLEPQKSSGVAGQWPNASREGLKAAAEVLPFVGASIVAAIMFGVTGGVAAGMFTAGMFMAVWAENYLDWWLYERLLCLDDDVDHCAIGIVWQTHKPEDKEGFEAFDDDYSIDLLLSPAAPGDSITKFPTQGELVKSPASVRKVGFSTLGLANVAGALKTFWSCGGETAGSQAYSVKLVGNIVFPEDPDELPNHGAELDKWETYYSRLPSAGGEVWRVDQEKTSVPLFTNVVMDDVLIPDTQLLHCEFEGNGIADLRRWLPVVAAFSGAILGMLAVLAIILLAASPLVAALIVIAAVLLLLLIIYVAARLIAANAHHGDPEDAGWDYDAWGEPRQVVKDSPDACVPWDDKFDLVGIRGRWVYDSGHTRGWNELHPVRYIQRLATKEQDEELEARGEPPYRPTTDEDAGAKRDLFCAEVDRSSKPQTQENQKTPGHHWMYHPHVA